MDSGWTDTAVWILVISVLAIAIVAVLGAFRR